MAGGSFQHNTRRPALHLAICQCRLVLWGIQRTRKCYPSTKGCCHADGICPHHCRRKLQTRPNVTRKQHTMSETAWRTFPEATLDTHKPARDVQDSSGAEMHDPDEVSRPSVRELRTGVTRDPKDRSVAMRKPRRRKCILVGGSLADSRI